jgi:hypothetical protein
VHEDSAIAVRLVSFFSRASGIPSAACGGCLARFDGNGAWHVHQDEEE